MQVTAENVNFWNWGFHNFLLLCSAIDITKHVLSSTDKLVQLFMTCLTKGDLKAQLTATSALYALIFDSQKVRYCQFSGKRALYTYKVYSAITYYAIAV